MKNKVVAGINTAKLLLFWFYIEVLCLISRNKKPNNALRKMALLSYKLPPQFNSGTHRPLSFLKYADSSGWRTFGITNSRDSEAEQKNVAGLELLQSLPSDVLIHEASDNFNNLSWHFTPQIDGGLNEALSIVLSARKILTQERPSIILASAPPFCFAVAGLYLSKLTGIPLVLDYRDEWNLCPFEFVSKTKLDKWFESRCLRQAKLIIYTTQTHLNNHAEHFHIPASKQCLIFNGWDSTSTIPNPTKKLASQNNDSIIISYIGKLSEHVDLVGFIEFVENSLSSNSRVLKHITIRFIGPKNKRYSEYLNELIEREDLPFDVESIDEVKKSEALELMDSSNFLLMLCNDSLSGYIPGKIYDYLSRKVPVIAYGHPGEIADILQQTNAGYFIEFDDQEKFIGALDSAAPDLHSNEVLEEWLRSRTRQSQASKLFSIIAKLLAN